MIHAHEINIRPAVRADAIDVSDLLSRLGLNVPRREDEGRINDHWDHLWENNPYYKVFKEPVHYGWVMEHEQRIVGFFGCVPRVYYLNSDPIPLAIASQWGVEKEYREFTRQLCDRFFEQNTIATKLVTTAIRPTGRIFERYNGRPVPDPELGAVYMVPLHLKKLVMHRTRHLPRLFTAPIGIAMGILPFKWAYRKLRITDRTNEVELHAVGSDHDLFWERYISTHKGLLASRHSSCIKWYHATGTRGLQKRVFEHRDANGEITGYASMMEEPVPDNSALKRYKIIDLLALNMAVRQEMLKNLIGLAFREQCDVLEIHLPGLIGRADIPVRTMVRHVAHFPVFYQTTDPMIAHALEDAANWHISAFDGDTCLM